MHSCNLTRLAKVVTFYFIYSYCLLGRAFRSNAVYVDFFFARGCQEILESRLQAR